MRLSIFLLIASASMAQIAVPADPYELVGKTAATPMDRTEALALLNKAKRPMRLLSPATPPYLLTVAFTADRLPGEFAELWLGQQNWRWTAKLGDFAVNRIATRLGTFDEKPVGLVPMRLHMLRNNIFWAAQGVTAASQFRRAAVEWNGRPTTCLLVSDEQQADASAPRQWDESEYCIDDQTGLLQILSVAPGNYAVYSYSGQSFHGQPLPDRIANYIAGIAVIDANLRIEEPAEHEIASAAAGEKPVLLEEPMRRRVDLPSPSANSARVMVNAQIGPDGKVTVEEICAATDPTLGAQALERVKTMEFGRSNAQRQAYVEVRFGTASGLATAVRRTTVAPQSVLIEPYYLERTLVGPNRSLNTKEILARRSDGATLRMTWVGPPEHGQFVRDLKFPDGRSLTIYDGVKAKVTWPARPAGSLPGSADCSAGRTRLRRDQIEGQEVDVFQTTAGSYRITMWAAPKLACENLYVNSEAMQQDGSFRPAMETKTTRLEIGEPDARLFEIAPDAAEMKPSEAQRRLWESLDLGLSAEQKAAMVRNMEREGAEADRRYLGKGN
jgi:hypothetical protein